MFRTNSRGPIGFVWERSAQGTTRGPHFSRHPLKLSQNLDSPSALQTCTLHIFEGGTPHSRDLLCCLATVTSTRKRQNFTGVADASSLRHRIDSPP